MSAIRFSRSPPRRAAPWVAATSSAASPPRSIAASRACIPRMIVSRFEKSCAIPLVTWAAISLRRVWASATRVCVSSVTSVDRI